LGAQADAQLIRAIRDAQAAFGVLVIRDQHLDEKQLVSFACNFGPLQNLGLVGKPDQFAATLTNVDDQGNILPSTDRMRRLNEANKLWHTDATYLQVRATLSMLLSLIVPKSGVATEYCDTRVAYEALPPERQRQLERLTAQHSLYHSRSRTGFNDWTEEMLRLLPKAVTRPLVETHAPSGRKALILASHIERVDGMPLDEGRALVEELIAFATTPERVYRHEWRPHDLVIWDNRCTMHRAMPFNEDTEPRKLWTVRVADAAEMAA
jgi:alpha-ketoglutarate-dependent 2,4-dichlorophenoxyacetate dioxygenase